MIELILVDLVTIGLFASHFSFFKCFDVFHSILHDDQAAARVQLKQSFEVGNRNQYSDEAEPGSQNSLDPLAGQRKKEIVGLAILGWFRFTVSFLPR